MPRAKGRADSMAVRGDNVRREKRTERNKGRKKKKVEAYYRHFTVFHHQDKLKLKSYLTIESTTQSVLAKVIAFLYVLLVHCPRSTKGII